MKKELFSIVVLVCFIAGGLSACCSKQVCPPCQTGFGQTQFVPQTVSANESAMTSRRSTIK